MLEHIHAKLIALVGVVGATVLLASPAIAHANEFAPPTLPQDAPAPAPTPEPTTTSAPAIVEVQPPVAPPAPRVDRSLALTGTTLWDGLNDLSVSLILRNENQLDGTVVAQDANTIALARASDGSVVAVPKREIQGVRLRSTSSSSASGAPVEAALAPIGERPLNSGRKLYTGGVVMLTFGAPLSLAGLTMLGIAPGFPVIWAPTLLPGIGLIVGGAIAVKRGKDRGEAFRRAWGIPQTSKLQLTPTFGVGRNGGQVGVAMRF